MANLYIYHFYNSFTSSVQNVLHLVDNTFWPAWWSCQQHSTVFTVSFDISPTKFSTTALSSTIVFGFSLQPLPLLLPRSKHPVGLDQDSLQARRNLSGWKLLFFEIHSGGRPGDNRENPSIKKLYSSHNFWHTLIPHFINVTRVVRTPIVWRIHAL